MGSEGVENLVSRNFSAHIFIIVFCQYLFTKACSVFGVADGIRAVFVVFDVMFFRFLRIFLPVSEFLFYFAVEIMVRKDCGLMTLMV